jgi:7-carboxy-7-deazaguanine synthase
MLRVTEVYLSTQGEGPNVGDRTVFVRFAGCNLRCPLWPCDTPFAIYPEQYRNTWIRMDAEQLVSRVQQVTNRDKGVRVCFTGGEPMIQHTDSLMELIYRLKSLGYEMEMFTNGTLLYPVELLKEVRVVMDWKLPGSGEDPFNRERIANLKNLDWRQSIKFVCADKTDYAEAAAIWDKYIVGTTDARVYYGVAWGKLDAKELVAWVLEDQLPWTLNIQVHNLIWDPKERGR